MSTNPESRKAGDSQDGNLPANPPSCRKKKSEVDEGFVKDMINHIDEFVNASYDEHKSCLQKTVRKLFGATKAVETSASAPQSSASAPKSSASAPQSSTSASPPVLPLRVDTSPERRFQL